jgi:hypothetical protein
MTHAVVAAEAAVLVRHVRALPLQGFRSAAGAAGIQRSGFVSAAWSTVSAWVEERYAYQ